jgi:hypothetical protein
VPSPYNVGNFDVVLLSAKSRANVWTPQSYDGIVGRDVPGMKELYNTFRFLLACVIIFGSGYLLAKPHNGADKLFAPSMCLIAVYSLWRGRTPTDPSLEP